MVRSAPIALLLVLAAPLAALAQQDAGGRDAPGLGPSGLPGLFRIGVAAGDAPGLGVAATAGYGSTEAQEGESGSHHRLAGILGVGVAPTPWLGLALRLDGRYDAHPDDAMGSDDGLVGAPSLLVRAGSRLGAIRLGGEIGVTVPGKDAPSIDFGALVLDASVLAAFDPEGSPFALAARVGYRLDNSSEAVDPDSMFRPGDRLAIGLSEFDALLLGLGFSWRSDPIEVIGEFTWDLLLGDGAPSAGGSPMRITAGARYHASDSLAFVLVGEVSPSSRPDFSAGTNVPYYPIEPRVSIWLGLRWAMSFVEPSPAVAGDADTDTTEIAETEQPEEPEQTEEQPEQPEQPALPAGQIRGLVRDFSGSPLQASVVVQRVAGEGEAETEPVGAETDADGLFTVDVQPGTYRVTIRAAGHHEQERTVTVEQNGVTVLNADLRRGGG